MNAWQFARGVVVGCLLLLPLRAAAVGGVSNSPPVAVNDSATASNGVPCAIPVLANDYDPNGDFLSIIGFSQGAHGTVSLSGTQLVYQAATQYCGGDTFIYTISDGRGGTNSASVSVNVVGCGVSNRPPVAVNDFAWVASGGSLLIPVLTNDYDPDGNPFYIVGYTQPTNGSVFQSGSDMAYYSAPGYVGQDFFTYTITDGTFYSNALVTVTVTNPPPNASADLSVTKYGPPDPLSIGDQVTYSIYVNNFGPATATNVIVRDAIPSGTVYVSASAAGACTFYPNFQRVDCEVGDMPANSWAYVTVTVQVTNTGPIINFANAYGTNPDPDTSDNASGVTNNAVAAQADLSMTKGSSVSGSVAVGDFITYTLYAYNYGPSLSSNVIVRDAIPSGTVYVSASGGSCTYYPNFQRVDCAVGNLPAYSSAFVYVTVQVTNTGPIVNFANAYGDTPDPNTTNNASGVTNSAVAPQADVSMTKYSSAFGTVVVGDYITYTLYAYNYGPSISTNVIVRDAIPSGTVYVSATGGACTYYPNFQRVDCDVGDLVPSGNAYVYVTVQVTNTGAIVNFANAYGDTPDPNTGNNASGVTNTAAAAEADLGIQKSGPADPVFTGNQITYTLYAQNSGPLTATNVVVSDTLPAGISYVSATGGACTYDSVARRVDCALSVLYPGNGAYVYVTVQVNQSGQLVNTASITSSTLDSNTTNNTSRWTNNVTSTSSADLSLTKYSSSSNNVSVGQQIIYTLSVFNSGPASAPNAAVSDTIPSGTTYIGASGGACVYNSAQRRVDCGVGTLGSGAQATVYVTVQVTNTGPLVNCASVSADAFDPNTANNTSCVTNTGVAAQSDLSLTKYTSTTNTLSVGSQIIYTLGGFNGGPSVASNVVVSDSLPAGVTLVSVTGSGVSYSYNSNQNRVDVNLGNLAVAASTTTYITVQVNAQVGAMVNCATISGSVTDSNPANNTSCVTNTTAQPSADLQITKTATTNTVSVGSTLVFNLRAQNNGPSPVTNQIVISEVIPSGYEYVGDVASAGFYSFGLGQWTLPNGLGASTTQTLAITVRATNSGVFTNTAIINVPSGVTDPNNANNTSRVTVTNTASQADLQITKIANTNNVPPGGAIGFTITVSNRGPSAANNVMVQDNIPAGVTVTGSNVPPGTIYNNGTWTIPNLANGSALALQLTMTKASEGSVTNVATVSAATADPNPNNNTNSAAATWTVSTDLGIRLALATNVVLQGSIVTVEFYVTNRGPNVASNIVIGAPWPAGTEFINGGANPNWIYDPPNGRWTRTANIVPNFELFFSFDIRPTNAGVVPITAALTNSMPVDVLTNNNYASTNFTVVAVVNIFGTARECTNNGALFAGVTVICTGTNGITRTNVTDANGAYAFTNLTAGSYTITATTNGFGFTPASFVVNSAGGTITNPPFVSTRRTLTGVVLSGTNGISGVAGITIQLTGAANTTAITDTNGVFTFTNLNPGNYTLTPVTNGVPAARFTPTNTTYTLGNPTNCSTNFTFRLTNTVIVLRAIEVNQAVQDWENSVPLVKSKLTVVRVFLQLFGTNTTPVTVSNVVLSSVRGSRDGPQYTVTTNDVSGEDSRTNRLSSVNFYLPGNWLNGNLEMKFSCSGAVVLNQEPLEARGGGVGSNGAVVVNFEPMPAVSVKWVRVAVTNAAGGTNVLSVGDIEELEKRLKAIFPIAAVHSKRVDVLWTRQMGAPYGASKGKVDDLNAVIAFMRYADVLFDQIGWVNDPMASKRLYYGAYDNDIKMDYGGSALGIPGDVSCGGMPSDQWLYGRNRHGHEMAHSLGRYHAAYRIAGGQLRGDFGDVAPTNAPVFPFLFSYGGKKYPTLGPLEQGENKVVYGWDSNARIVVDPYTTFELMSYVKPGWRWISSWTYTNVQNAIIDRFGPAARPAGIPKTSFNYRIVRGLIDYATQTVRLQPFYTITPGTPLPTPAPGTFSVRCYDAGNVLLTEIPFEPEDIDHDSPEEGDPSGLFMVPVPENPAIDHIEIWHDGNLVLGRQGSAHAPFVQVLAPNGGEAFGAGAMNISWLGSDADGEALTYVVQYSFDGGTSWDTLVADWAGTSLQVDAATLPATTQGRIRVIASDGFHTWSDASDGTFTVLNHAPAISITTPPNGSMFIADEQVVLTANANDVDDGPLDGTNIVWRSSRDGLLGTDTTLELLGNTLSEGTHTITATAIDSAGLTNVASISITIYRETPPRLSIERAAPDVLISWPITWPSNSPNYRLQYADTLPSVWNNASNSVSVTSNRAEVRVPTNNAPRYYRLIRP